MLTRTIGTITLLPVFHGRLEFAAEVRQRLLADPPQVVAVEFPNTWREPILQAVNRLPFLSLILGEEEAQHLFLPIEPTDALVEAIRTGRELGLPVEFIDLDVEHYPQQRDPVPDSHALHRLGYEQLLETVYAQTPFPRAPFDDQRETMMAHALQQLAADGRRVVAVVGAAHLPGLIERLRTAQPRPLARAKPRALRLCNWSEKSSREFMTEGPFLAAAYEKARQATAAPVLEGMEPERRSLSVDREDESERLVRRAVDAYRERYGEDVTPQRRRLIGVFAKKYALVQGHLVPDLYQLVVAARGTLDDDLAYELWNLGSHYPWQDGSGLLPTIDLEENFAFVDGRRLTLHRKIRRQRPRLQRFSDKKRLREQFSGRWKAQWSGRYICSHQPEDLVIEDYGRYLKHRAKGMLTAQRTRVEPFQVSLKDGIDIRETLRNWHEGRLYVRDEMPLSGKVGSVVVIFDEDRAEGGKERYPWMVTWLGENDQESDMALYSTPAGEELVGPGISQCEYGGFALTYPPQRMVDVWSDPFFDSARSKAERLLLAAIDYAVERHVLYVAERPPRQWFHSLAERAGRKLIYLPLGQLNPKTLKRVRHFHVLDGQHVRAYSAEYIRKTPS